MRSEYGRYLATEIYHFNLIIHLKFMIMKKAVINLVLVYFVCALILAVILSSCSSTVHCDAYSQAENSQNNDLVSK